MKNVFIVHEAYGYPDDNWFPWLKIELEKQGYKVIIPQFPTPEGQTLNNWLEVFESYKDYLSNSIVIGHSLGMPFLLTVLEQYKVDAAFFVGGFYTIPKGSQFYEGAKTFVEKEFDFDEIKRNCKKFVIFHSDNDPYVSLRRAELLARELGVQVSLIRGAGHFNSSAGYDKFEELLKAIYEIER